MQGESLFDYADRTPAEERAAGQLGMERALEHAERETPSWGDKAFGFLMRFAAANRHREFLAEEIAPWARDRGCPPPPDKRAWGAVIQRGRKKRLIEPTGLAAKNKLSGHNSTWRPLWRSVGND